MRRLAVVAAALAAVLVALGAWRASVLPTPWTARGAPPSAVREVRVAYHVPSNRADGTAAAAKRAAAAAAAELEAVNLTDHGDGTRATDPPRRLDGVLVVDAAEIGSWGGHYVALDARPSPYPLGGDPASVVEDVARLGGFGIAAHPGSSKDGLKWRAWDAPFDGLEWLNADSEWRDRPRDLWLAVLSYPWSPTATIVRLLNRPVFELSRWDRATAQRPVVGLAAHDAHARLGLSGVGEPYDGAVALRAPGYAAMFRAFSNTVQVPAGWGGDASSDTAALFDAIRAGRAYTVVTGLGRTWVRRFTASAGGQAVAMGAHLAPSGPVTFDVDVEAPASALTARGCDGTPVATVDGGRLTWRGDRGPGACHGEVTLPAGGRPMPRGATHPLPRRPPPRR